MLALSCALLLALPQAPEAEVLVRLPAGITVTRAEYRDHLEATVGGARLEELVLDRILAREVEALSVASIPPATRAILADPAAEVRARLAERIAKDHGGDRDAWVRLQERLGLAVAEVERATLLQVLRDARTAALVQTRRGTDAAAVRRAFEEHYGVDGQRAVVRHALVSFGAVRAQLRAGHDAHEHPAPAEADVEARARTRADELAALARQGAPFHELVLRGDDPAARAAAQDPGLRERAGRIEGYNYQHFGVEFAAAVRAMQPGEVRGPVRTTYGYHWILLESRTTTKLADVQERVLELLRQEPPRLAEQRELFAELRTKYQVTRPLPR